MIVNEQLFKRGATVAVAVSGGKDSMALLHWCMTNSQRLGFVTSAVNLDHQLRGKSSAQDSAFVKDYCILHNIPLLQSSADTLQEFGGGGSIEAAARRARYNFFRKALKEGFADYIVTAHHLDDCAETVLLNLLRGSGLKGLRGIAQTNGKVLRPLLSTARQEIDRYISENNIPYVTDETNTDTKFCRNYIRHKVMPVISERFPSAAENIASFARLAKSDEECLELMRPEPITEDGKVYIPEHYFGLHQALISRTIIRALNLMGVDKDIESKHIQLIMSLFDAPTGVMLDIKSGVTAVRVQGKVVLTAVNPHERTEYLFPFRTGEIILPVGTLVIIPMTEQDLDKTPHSFDKSSPRQELRTLYIDADKVPPGCHIRNRNDGDKLALFGGGTTTLKKLFQSKGIDITRRNMLPVIAAPDNTVIAVAGVEISADYRLDTTTKQVYIITFFTEDNHGKNNQDID